KGRRASSSLSQLSHVILFYFPRPDAVLFVCVYCISFGLDRTEDTQEIHIVHSLSSSARKSNTLYVSRAQDTRPILSHIIIIILVPIVASRSSNPPSSPLSLITQYRARQRPKKWHLRPIQRIRCSHPLCI